jgi:SAM-dependent methyltransferase
LKDDLSETAEMTAAADIAAKDFFNEILFPNLVYIGVDIEADRLQKGLAKLDKNACKTEFQTAPLSKDDIQRYKRADEPHRVGVCGDILECSLFPPDSLDVVVSTNTLSHLPESDYPRVVESFCTYLRPGGNLYFNVSANLVSEQTVEKVVSIVNDRFQLVDKVAYNTGISKSYDKPVVENDDGYASLSANGAIRYTQYAISLFLSMVESLGLGANQRYYLRCQSKVE